MTQDEWDTLRGRPVRPDTPFEIHDTKMYVYSRIDKNEHCLMQRPLLQCHILLEHAFLKDETSLRKTTMSRESLAAFFTLTYLQYYPRTWRGKVEFKPEELPIAILRGKQNCHDAHGRTCSKPGQCVIAL